MVHAGRLRGDRDGRTLCWHDHSCARENRNDPGCDVSSCSCPLCVGGGSAIRLVCSAFSCGRIPFTRRSVGPAEDDEEFFRHWPLSPRCRQTVKPVRLGLVRGWFCGAELRGILVLPSFWREPGHARYHFLLGKYLCGDFRI